MLLSFLAAVLLWQDTTTLPTYRENDPDVNPTFDLFRPKGPFVYPYTMRTGLGGPKSDTAWRTLHLENEYLHCRILPDLGGRLHGCLDKRNGQEMFFANPVVKKDWIAPRASWVALGIEQNFPLAHSLQTVSPTSFVTRQNEDGSASAIVSAVDRLSGMQWQVEYTLRPGRAYLEQRATFYNRGETQQRYQWWSNAAIRLREGPVQFILPAYVTEPHGPGPLEPWPISSTGIDRSTTASFKDGAGFFAHQTREPFFGAYTPATRTGVLHYADPQSVPGKKIWVWGSEGDKYVRDGLTDDGSSYVEIQSGVFANQDTFEFLQPSATRTATEYWVPVRDMAGVSRANLGVLANLRRTATSIEAEVAVTADTPGVTIRLRRGIDTLFTAQADLSPDQNFRRAVTLAEGVHTLEVLDASGAVLLAHTENTYDAIRISETNLPAPSPGDRRDTDQDYLDAGLQAERAGFRDTARQEYQRGLTRFASSTKLAQAAGRLAAILGRNADAIRLLAKLEDPESRYYLALAHSQSGNDGDAWVLWDSIRDAYPAAKIQLAGILGRAGELASAAELFEEANTLRSATLAAATYRRLDDLERAAAILEPWRAKHPADLLLRIESKDDTVWPQLAQEPEWVLDAASDYMHTGLWQDAQDLLARTYAAPAAHTTEPGAVLPQSHPLVSYYRAYVKQKLGASPDADFRTAAAQSVRFVFPSRASSYAVLRAAIAANGNDANARFLLGALYMNSQMVEEARAEWLRAQAINPNIPGLAESLRQSQPLVPR